MDILNHGILMKKIYIIYFVLLLTANLMAQLSPGDLSRPHSSLEGLKNCTKCHQIGEKVSPEKCLDCHQILQERIQSGKGLHAQSGYGECVLCHSDHQGRNFELVWWKDGQDNFDHSKTGYELKGKHNELRCQQCHQSKNNVDPGKFNKHNKDLDKTFLGLNQNCLSCHSDEHHDQLSQDCLKCHQMTGWKPAPNFNHDEARYKLIGKHRSVPCASCHIKLKGEPSGDRSEYLKFTGLLFKNCNDCHKDPHKNRLGDQCTQCHNLSGWKGLKDKSFNHTKTRFPLRGLHKNLSCEKCHTNNRSLTQLRFEHCRDCHRDYHQGQFVNRPQRGACEECHTEEGFQPAKFTLAQHNQSKYPLQGAHLAVPCNFCHQKTHNNTLRFEFESTACIICHSDPHNGTAHQYVVPQKSPEVKVSVTTQSIVTSPNSINDKDVCEYCHSVQSWQ